MNGLEIIKAELDCGCLIWSGDATDLGGKPYIKIECCPTHKIVEVDIDNVLHTVDSQ